LRLRTAFKIVEWTALPLLIFSGLMIISGYGLVSESAREASLGVLNFSRSQSIHLGRFFRIGFFILLILHSYAGTELMVKRLTRAHRRLSIVVEYSIVAFLIYVAWIVFNGEFRG